MPSESLDALHVLPLARRLAANYSSWPQVEAVALAGSHTSRFHDTSSDIDLYVYVTAPIALDARAKIAAGAEASEIGNERWEPGDEWVDRETGASVDVMFRRTGWIEEQLNRILKQHQASVGYSTCFWYNVRHSEVLFDRAGWFASLKELCETPYPEELKQAIIAKNYPLLRDAQSSYSHQIELAFERDDLVSLNHRVAAFLASYFDVLFAINELPHPGEKRLLQHATSRCKRTPVSLVEDVEALIAAIAKTDGSVVSRARRLGDGLEQLLRSQGLFHAG
jgi:hypothetical protein